MVNKRVLSLLAVTALLLLNVADAAVAAEKEKVKGEMKIEKVESSTVSPIADMAAIIDTEMKTSTERPPTKTEGEEMNKKTEKIPTSQRHTVADFIIHPLVAFKPRNPEEGIPAAVIGKQASTDSSTPAPAPSAWQIFSLNAGQTIGSSVSSLTNWLNDRIQLPGLVDTPVRDSTTTSSTTTTTTTPRPDIVVKVQHRPSTTRRPLISINNDNRPNLPPFDSTEDDDIDLDEDYDDDNGFAPPNRRRGGNHNNNNNSDDDEEENEESEENNDNNNDDDNNNSNSNEEEEDNNEVEEDGEEEENKPQRQNNRRRPVRRNKNRNNQNQLRRRRPGWQSSRQQQDQQQEEDDESSNESNDDYDDNNEFYYGSQAETKRSRQPSNIIRRGQQRLISQIRQLTRGHSPAEIGDIMRNSNRVVPSKRRQQATLFVNRNGQTVYVAPELSLMSSPHAYERPVQVKVPASGFPQPPLTKPMKLRGEPTQYITIPWSKLGISPPNNLVAITEGIQTQPLILNIPQSALTTMQNTASQGTRKRPTQQLITAEAVPLLAEASLMDIFKPPEIPPSRTAPSSSNSITSNTKTSSKRPSGLKMTPVLLHQHIRPNTVVEKAPTSADNAPELLGAVQVSASEPAKALATSEKEFIVVGDDNEPGLNRHVEPVVGEARYIRGRNRVRNPAIFEILQPGRIVWRNGARSLDTAEEVPMMVTNAETVTKTEEEPSPVSGKITEEHIPVAIVEEPQAPPKEALVVEVAKPKQTEAEAKPGVEVDAKLKTEIQIPGSSVDSETIASETHQTPS